MPKSMIFDVTVARQQEVVRLDVAMDDALAVRGLQPLGDLRCPAP